MHLLQYKQIDWDKLREDDTTLFMQRRDEMRELEKSIEDGHKQQQNLVYQVNFQKKIRSYLVVSLQNHTM